MKNKKYIQSICDKCYKETCEECCHNKHEQANRFDCSCLMMVGSALDWKDKQFKEYLENQRKGLLEQIDKHKSRGYGYDSFEECYTYMAAKLLRIIEELFGETEQDNSARED